MARTQGISRVWNLEILQHTRVKYSPSNILYTSSTSHSGKPSNTTYLVVWNTESVLYNIQGSPPEEGRGVAQERNEKHPAWNEYHYAGNRRIKIVFGYLVRTINNTLINKRTLHFRPGRYLFFAYTWRQTLWSYIILGILCNIIS